MGKYKQFMEYPISIIIPASDDYLKKYGPECLASIPGGCEVLIIPMEFGKDRWVDLLNKGIDMAKNEWILPLGIDDTLCDGIIQRLISEIDDSDVYFSPLQMFGNSNYLMIPNKNPTIEDFKKSNQVYFTSMFRKSKAKEIGGYYTTPDNYFYEDWDFWFRMKLANAKFKYIDTPIFNYRSHENQSYLKMLKDQDSLREKIIKHCLPNE